MRGIDILEVLEATGEYVPVDRLERELAGRLESARRLGERHAAILREGAQDPFWEDGAAANLVRHQLLFERGRIEGLCKRLHRAVPVVDIPRAVRPDATYHTADRFVDVGCQR